MSHALGLLTGYAANSPSGAGGVKPGNTFARSTPGRDALSASASGARVEFLAAKAPKPRQLALDVPALRHPVRLPDAEVAKFARYVAAVENPAGVLEDMSAGAVSQEAVEALRTVYPAVHADVREQLVQMTRPQRPTGASMAMRPLTAWAARGR